MPIVHICVWLLTLLPQEPQGQDRPLPDQTTFMEEFRKSMRNPNKLLSQYTYTEKETETSLDSKGKQKDSETNVYQVIQGEEDWRTYRRHISKNGVALTAPELEKQDRKERERIANETSKRANWSEAKKQ